MTFDRGYLHSEFAAGSATNTVSLTNCLIVLFDGRAAYATDGVPLLQRAKELSQPLLVVADDIDGDALETLILNHREGVARCVAVKAPGFADRRSAILKDIASFTGARLIERALGRSLVHVSPADFGRAELVRVTRDQTTLMGGGGTPDEVERRAAEIRAEIEYAIDDLQREKAQERLGHLRGRIVTLLVLVGGATGTIRDERRELTANAVFAVQAALESGIVTGGGVSLMKARIAIDPGSAAFTAD